MQTILEEFIESVKQGKRFYINFEKRHMKIGKKWLIKAGKVEDERERDLAPLLAFPVREDVLIWAETLYLDYKYSVPSERSENRQKNYFKSLPIEKLTDEDLATGEQREVARAKLEGFLLACIVAGVLTWDEDWGSYFWQSKVDPDFVIMKEWIVGKEKN